MIDVACDDFGFWSCQVILEKVQAPGTWGFALDDNAILFGPRDTWGHEGSALPYYASGGSTGTDAPSNLIDQGEGDSTGGTEPDPSGDPPASAGGPLSHGGTGGLVNTAGGGPPGARVFNKHGDVIPASARGEHPDYWEEEVVEVATFGPSTSPVAVTTTQLQASRGSPPSPLYRFKVVACDSNSNCADKKRYAYTMQTVDIGLYEPKATFWGDLDPKTRVIMGEITVVAPAFAMGLQGYRLYPTADGNTNLDLRWSDTTIDEGTGAAPTQNAQKALNLNKSCPPDSANEDWTTADASWQLVAREPCGNDNPYSPKCRGKSCTHINILPGSQGEFYISRFDNNGNAENPDGSGVDDGVNSGGGATDNNPQQYTSNTARRNYGDNEWAQIYLPRDGWLTPIMMDVASGDDGDTLLLKTSASDGSPTNLKDATLSNYIDITVSESMIEWATDSHNTAHGWTLIFQPNYPEVELPLSTPMAQGASGFRVVNVGGKK